MGAVAAPQTFNTALPVGSGDSVLRAQVFRISAGGDPTPAARELDVSGAVAALGYGASGKVAVFGVVPYLDKQLDFTAPDGQRVRRGTRGLGDAQLFVRYTSLQKDQRGASFRVAPFAGIKLPTGDDDARDALGRLPQPLQSGSGSWDPFAGIVATRQTLAYQADVQLSYTARNTANRFEFGDETRFDVSLQYRLLPRELGAGVPGFLYGVLEANLVHQRSNTIDGARDPDSGGTTAFLSAGLQYVTKRWIAEAVIQVPVSQHLNGTALDDDYTFRAGLRVNF